VKALLHAGFAVEGHVTGNGRSPYSTEARRARHLSMRRYSQQLTRGRGRVLYLEDDTLVPPDVWARLSLLLDEGYAAASGLQVSRHGNLRAPGLWVNRGDVWATVWPSVASPVSACGHYCLMTDGDTYGASFTCERGEAIDRAHTRTFGSIACDPECVCGHLLDDGSVLTRPDHLVAYRGQKEVARVKAVRTPAGTFWPDLHADGYTPDDSGTAVTIITTKGRTVRDPRMYITKGVVVRGRGRVEVGRRREIPLEEAQRLHAEGCRYIDGPYEGDMAADPELYPDRTVFDPREEFKPDDPRTALKNVCPDCGKVCKSAAGLASHIAAGKC
jgi:hypothetical protein